jgi:hypothetical protein
MDKQITNLHVLDFLLNPQLYQLSAEWQDQTLAALRETTSPSRFFKPKEVTLSNSSTAWKNSTPALLFWQLSRVNAKLLSELAMSETCDAQGIHAYVKGLLCTWIVQGPTCTVGRPLLGVIHSMILRVISFTLSTPLLLEGDTTMVHGKDQPRRRRVGMLGFATADQSPPEIENLFPLPV